MKTIFRFTGLAVMLSAVIGFSAASAAAQDPCEDADAITALDAKIRENYGKNETVEVAINAGKEFLEKYGKCDATKDFVAWLQPQIPNWEKRLADRKLREYLAPRYQRVDAGVQSNNADEVLAAGKEILAKLPEAKLPEDINLIIAMGLVAQAQSTAANNYKYTDDGLKYSSMALAKVKGGEKFAKKNKEGQETAGIYWTEKTRPELTADLSYAIAYLNYFGKKDKQTALPIFYELAQGSYKDNPFLFGVIGDYYVEQRKPIGEQITAKINEQNAKETSEERKVALEDEIKKLVALFNGYNERILDAYSRAYKVTKDTPANKAYRDNLYKVIQDVYKRRFPDSTASVDAYITTTTAKPFPNPTSEVTPVSDPEPAKTTTSTAPVTTAPAPNGKTTASATTPAQPAAAMSKPVSNGKPAAANGKATAVTKPRR